MILEEKMEMNAVSLSLRRMCPYFMVIVIALFAAFMGLGVLRLYSFRLECRLNGIENQIESFRAQQIRMSHELSSLLSPGKIYGFSINKLGMVFASNVTVLKVDGTLLASSQTGEADRSLLQNGEREEGWFSFLTGKAAAKD